MTDMKNGGGSVTEVAPGVRKITPRQEPDTGWETPNIYAVGTGPVTLIDSGYDRPSSLDLILEALGDADLERIVLTHGHIDHAGSAWKLREMKGCPVMAHELDAASISRRFPGVKADEAVLDGDLIRAGTRTLKAIHTPGHTPGHVCLFDENDGTLFTGDLVTGSGSTLVAPPEGNMADYMRSLKRVRDLAASALMPGHGSVRTDPLDRVLELIGHRELREVNVAACLMDGPKNLKDLVKAMYLGLIHPSLEMAAAATAWAHLDKMIEDGNAVAGPEGETNPFNRTYELTGEAMEKIKALLPDKEKN